MYGHHTIKVYAFSEDQREINENFSYLLNRI